jgi:adenylate kinase family enzyme
VPSRPAPVVLGPDDDVVAAVGRAPRRVLVAGTSGSGKTTLAGRIAVALGVAHTELDSLHWGPGWTPRPQFADDVRALAAQEAWVMEWQYREVRPLLLERAEVLVWLDLPVHVVMRQLVVRTVYRRLGRVVLWNGNIEPPLWTLLSDEDHVVRWAWRMRHKLRGLDERLAERAPHLALVRLRNRRDVDRWVARLDAASRSH